MRKEWMMAGLMLVAPVIAVAQTTPGSHSSHKDGPMRGNATMTPAPTPGSRDDASAAAGTSGESASGTNAVDAMNSGTETMNESSSMGSNAAEESPPPK